MENTKPTIDLLECSLTEHFMRHSENPKSIYISCNLIEKLLVEINKNYVDFTMMPKLNKEYIIYLVDFKLEYSGIPIYRIIEDNHIIIK